MGQNYETCSLFDFPHQPYQESGLTLLKWFYKNWIMIEVYRAVSLKSICNWTDCEIRQFSVKWSYYMSLESSIPWKNCFFICLDKLSCYHTYFLE